MQWGGVSMIKKCKAEKQGKAGDGFLLCFLSRNLLEFKKRKDELNYGSY